MIIGCRIRYADELRDRPNAVQKFRSRYEKFTADAEVKEISGAPQQGGESQDTDELAWR